jgi:uncharacterized membrane protein
MTDSHALLPRHLPPQLEGSRDEYNTELTTGRLNENLKSIVGILNKNHRRD